MADSIREKIMANILTTFQTISIANGFENNIESVQRYEQNDQNLQATPAIIIVEGVESSEDSPDPLTTNVLIVEGMLYASHDRTASISTAEFLNKFIQDIKKAIKVDNTRGANAVDSMIKSSEPFETDEDQPFVGIIFEIEVTYRHRQTDPTIVG